MNRYLIVVEEWNDRGERHGRLSREGSGREQWETAEIQTDTGYSAYSPDLPGCVATGGTRDNIEREMHDAIEFHLDGLRRAGKPIPSPRSEASYCDVGA